MKTDYDKAIAHLKVALIVLGESSKNFILINKIRAIVNDLENIKIKEKKDKINKKNKDNFNFISKYPKKSIEIIENLIEEEINSLENKEK